MASTFELQKEIQSLRQEKEELKDYADALL